MLYEQLGNAGAQGRYIKEAASKSPTSFPACEATSAHRCQKLSLILIEEPNLCERSTNCHF
jgi:hypothetical protein